MSANTSALSHYTLSKATLDFLARSHGHFINGKWVHPASGTAIDIHDPATGLKISSCSAGGATEIDTAVTAARTAFEGPWSRFTAAQRSTVIWKISDLIVANFQQLCELEILDNGLPTPLAQYVCGMVVPEFFRYYAGWPTKIEGSTIPAAPQGKLPGEALSFTLREPIGVVGAITPWNSPLPMVMLKIAPALATGCTLVLKPAELTPLTAMRLAEICQEAGVPAGVINIVNGYGESAGAALAAHPGVDKIAFTGSTEVGRLIVKAAAGNLKKVTLELGGKSPVVVFPDADLEQVIPGAARACFFLQGQNCMAGTRLFVHEKVHDKVVEGIAAIARSMKLGPGLDPTSEFGPLISSQQRDRVSGFVEAGRKEGAEVICGGTAPTRPGYFFEPTVLARTHNDMTPVKNEIFGPVLCVQTFSDGDLDAIARAANSTIYGLSGSVWTRDLGTAMQMVRKIDAGQVSVNMHAAIDPAVPFGGNKQSGWGREFGEEGLEPYLKTKGISMTW
ncbi:MAG: aldehyde dehydrogenase family protein [Gammaproteobacteria bacterium]|nr:aldehyde dehydrogenase family protein [Gammaproteobacteria bacterium]